MVNSKENSQDWLALNSAVAYNKVLARAAQKAGLYTFSLAPTVVKKADYKADAWKVDGSDINTQNLLYKMRQELSPANLALKLPMMVLNG